jgi:hypothetical protein
MGKRITKSIKTDEQNVWMDMGEKIERISDKNNVEAKMCKIAA